MATTPPETGYLNSGESNVANLVERDVAEFPVPPSHQIPAETSAAQWRRPAMETALQCYAEAVGRTLGLATRTYRQLFDRARGYTQESYEQVERETKVLGRRAQRNAWYMKERYPLETLGGIAATAFVAGVVLRVWRSRS